MNWISNLENLLDAILEERYEPGASIAFVIFDPNVREIFAAGFRDRVVHHFLYNMQAGWWDAEFIDDSYSCRKGKGTLYGIRRAQRYMRIATDNYTRKAYVVKLDIQGYFMSLPREKIYRRVRWGLERQFASVMDDEMGRKLFRICDYLWREVIFDDPVRKAKKRGPIKNWNPQVLPYYKSLFAQPYGKGIVIGNLTSQLVSNMYLDLLDKYITEELRYEWYGRYVDDFYIMVEEERYLQLKADVKKIEKFLLDELELVLHPRKRYYQSVYKGMSFLGARVYPRCIYPSDRLQRNFCRAIDGVVYGYKDVESIVSYLGIMMHMDARKFVVAAGDRVGWRL